MFKKLILAIAILALAVASAGTVSKGSTYSFTLTQPCVVQGNTLQAGDYRVTLGGDKVTIQSGKLSVEVSAKIENVETKFASTSIRYLPEGGKSSLTEIRLGGTKTRLVFNP